MLVLSVSYIEINIYIYIYYLTYNYYLKPAFKILNINSIK